MLTRAEPPSSRSLYIALLSAIRRRQQRGSPFEREQLEQLLSHLPLHHRRNFTALLLEILLKRQIQRYGNVCHGTPSPSPPLDVSYSLNSNNCNQRLSVRRDLYRSCASNIDRSTSSCSPTPSAPRSPLSENLRREVEQLENLTRLAATVTGSGPSCAIVGCQNAAPDHLRDGLPRDRTAGCRRQIPTSDRRPLGCDPLTQYPRTAPLIQSTRPSQNYFRTLSASGSCPNLTSLSSTSTWNTNTARRNSWGLDRLSPHSRQFDFDDSSSTIYNVYPNPFLPVFGQAADTNTEAGTPVTSSSSCSSPHSAPAASPKEESSEISSSSSSNGCASSSSAGGGGETSNGSVSSSNGSQNTAATAAVSTSTSTTTTTTSKTICGVSTTRSGSKIPIPGSGIAASNPFARSTVDSSPSQPSRSILAPSKLGGFSSSSSSSSGGRLSNPLAPSRLSRPLGAGASVLAPPTLFGATPSSTSLRPSTTSMEPVSKFKLKPSILGSAVSSNPFSKAPAVDFEVDGKDSEAKAKSPSPETYSPPNARQSTSDKSHSVSSSNATSSNSCISSSDFTAPSSATDATNSTLTSSSSTPPPSPPSSSSRRDKEKQGRVIAGSVFGAFPKAEHKRPVACSSPAPSAQLLPTNGVKPPSSSFVFGRDLHSRVEGKSAEGDAADSAAASSSGSGGMESSDLIFSAAASNLASQSTSSSLNGGPSKDLETSSRELAEKESSGKRKFEPVQVLTGEETESNVIQMNCKVYCWVRGGWQERGRGVLRLNDWGSGGEEMHSRLLVRTQGTFSVMLNTNIWGEMVVERPSSKSVRFTASDPGGQPVIYLVMGLPKEIDTLHSSLEWRISNAKRRENSKRPRLEVAPSSSTPSL